MRSEDRAKKTQDRKKAPTKLVEMPTKTSAKQRRHERNISKAQARRDAAIRGKGAAHFKANEAQDKIDKKRATRARLRSLSPAARAERAAAGREHRQPRK